MPRCARCEPKKCCSGNDCFAKAEDYKKLYDDELIKLHHAAAEIEAKYYGKEPRLRETILFAQELGVKKLGLAFCVGLSEEAKIIESIFSRYFDVASVCCKLCGIDKKDLNLSQIRPERQEVMCNPVGQAQMLNDAGTELNVLCGLCVGHDAIFTKVAKAPVTTLIAKDRVLAHNPIGAVYSQYIRRKFTK
jgi:uncharacterized metal-binding protein